MTKLLLSIFAFSFLISKPSFAAEPARPKLVVGIVLDQMRWDYLYRFADRYGEGGFKRLMKDGFNCENTSINYLPSFTAPGHATIYTGSVPALHGIAANDWLDNRTMLPMYCTQDDKARPVGNNGTAGNMSPRNLEASTITDELRLATNFKAKTIGISLKDRGAIIPAGHSTDGAYWFDSKVALFITSTYYKTEIPAWVRAFNGRNVVDSLLSIDWTTLYPIETYTQSSVDNALRYEGMFKGEQAPVFPHRLKQYIGRDYGAIRSTPWGNTLIRFLAETSIQAEGLGQDDITDFLAVSFSSTDYIGHLFGPNSIEVEDCYLRMDKELELFLNYLDKQVGKGNYTLFLTADHGGAHNSVFLNDNGVPAGNVNDAMFNQNLNAALKLRFGVNDLTVSTNYQVYINPQKMEQAKLQRAEVVAFCREFLSRDNTISFVLDMKNPSSNQAPKEILEMATNGYNPTRSGDLTLILKPGYYSGYAPTGTTHGSWNPYDARIPLLFYGWGINKGESFAPYKMTDIAATIAALLHIQAPNACIGTPILEVLKK